MHRHIVKHNYVQAHINFNVIRMPLYDIHGYTRPSARRFKIWLNPRHRHSGVGLRWNPAFYQKLGLRRICGATFPPRTAHRWRLLGLLSALKRRRSSSMHGSRNRSEEGLQRASTGCSSHVATHTHGHNVTAIWNQAYHTNLVQAEHFFYPNINLVKRPDCTIFLADSCHIYERRLCQEVLTCLDLIQAQAHALFLCAHL